MVRSVVADAAGAIYVADVQANEIRVFGADGAHLRTIGRSGDGPGEFNALYALAWIGDTLAAFDPRNGRISFLSPEGDWLGSSRYLHRRSMTVGSTPRAWTRRTSSAISGARTGVG